LCHAQQQLLPWLQLPAWHITHAAALCCWCLLLLLLLKMVAAAAVRLLGVLIATLWLEPLYITQRQESIQHMAKPGANAKAESRHQTCSGHPWLMSLLLPAEVLLLQQQSNMADNTDASKSIETKINVWGSCKLTICCWCSGACVRLVL
jgi:hypothetical protein